MLGVVWTAGAAVVVGWPQPVDQPFREGLERLLADLHGAGLPAWVDYPAVEFAANIVFFVPTGIAAFLLCSGRIPGRGVRGLLAAFMTSGGIGLALSLLAESLQAMLLPDRVATPRDVAANLLGAVIGGIVAWWWWAPLAPREASPAAV